MCPPTIGTLPAAQRGDLRWFLPMTAMMLKRCALLALLSATVGCASMKQSDTARTGVEQLLISTATDRALDKVDLTPLRGAKVFVDTQYLDCVDKNYIIVSMHQRLLNNGSTLVAKVDDADVLMEVGSGGVGTDRNDMFVGIPEIPLPPPSPIALPKLAFFSRTKMMGTAKLRVLAYDVKTRQPVINADTALARSDYKNWNVLGTGPVATGKVPEELTAATGESESILYAPKTIAQRTGLRK